MADISKIQIEQSVYNIKDETSRADIQNLLDTLGNLAFKDSATGKIIPKGSVSTPLITATVSTTPVSQVTNRGELSSWNANVNDETLSFTFSAGQLPSIQAKNAVTAVTDITSSKPTFTGIEGTVTVE